MDEPAGFARFDASGRLVEASRHFFGAGVVDVGVCESALLTRALGPLTEPCATETVALWRAGRPVRAHHADGRVLLLSSCATADGRIYFASDVTAEAQDDMHVLRRVLDSCPAKILMCRIDGGEIIYATPAWRALFGATTHAPEHYADPSDRDAIIEALLASGSIDDHPIRCRRADGTEFPALVSARVVEYRGEDVIVSTIVDITETLQQKAAADAARERLTDAIESLDQGFAIYDRDSRLVVYNERYKKLNAHVAHVIRPGVAWQEVLDAAVTSGRLAEGELEKVRGSGLHNEIDKPRRQDFRHRDGRWFSVARTPTSDGGFVITRLDITEQKRREAEAREVDEIMARVLDACPVALVMTRLADGRILFQSAYSAEAYGRYEHANSFWVDRDARARWLAQIERTGRVDGMEMDARRADGSVVRVALSGRKVEFRGEPVIVSHAFDLTERIGMEAELARQREILHQSEKLSALGELLAGVAHELNNPLSVVVGHALMLEEEATDPAQRARIAKISAAAERCARIIKTFLAMARQRATRIDRVSLREVLETALEITAYSMRNAGIELEVRLDPDLHPVRADPDQMVQVFTNLLLNAENALSDQPGERVVSVSARNDRTADEVVVKIKDNGPGIPAAIRSRIFEPFFTTKAVNEGTGIGLAFCHRIVEAHDGRIYVRSTPGRGASFFLRLPAAKPAQAGIGAGVGPARAAAGLDVLVIEDEEEVAALIAEILESDGHRVLRAGGGEEGLAILDDQPVDMVLSDLNMPGLDGRAIFERIRRRFPRLARRTAFVTGDTMSPNAQAFLRRAGRPYLEKPVIPDELRALVESVRRLSAREAGAR